MTTIEQCLLDTAKHCTYAFKAAMTSYTRPAQAQVRLILNVVKRGEHEVPFSQEANAK